MIMAKIDFDDFERYQKKMEEMADPDTIRAEAKMAVYAGAGTAADAIITAIKNHPTHKNPVSGMTAFEQKALLDGFGISPMEEKDGEVNVKLGFDGYSSRKTKRWPNGVPVSVTARSLRRGTSWRGKDDFIGPAISKARKEVNAAMEKKLDEAIEKHFNKK